MVIRFILSVHAWNGDGVSIFFLLIQAAICIAVSAGVTTISPDALTSSTLAQIDYSLVSSSRYVPNEGRVR